MTYGSSTHESDANKASDVLIPTLHSFVPTAEAQQHPNKQAIHAIMSPEPAWAAHAHAHQRNNHLGCQPASDLAETQQAGSSSQARCQRTVAASKTKSTCSNSTCRLSGLGSYTAPAPVLGSHCPLPQQPFLAGPSHTHTLTLCLLYTSPSPRDA